VEHPILRHLNSLVAAARTPRVGIAARAVGRVGALAAALGVGGVLGGAGVAVAETPDSSQAADSESRAASAGSSSRSAAAPGGTRSRAGEGSARASRQPSRATGAAAADSPAADRVRRGPLDVTAGAGRGATERAGGLAGSGDSAAANPAVPAAAPERVVTAPVAGSVGAPRAVTDPVPGGGAAALAGLPAAAAESVSAATAPTEVPTAAAPVASAASAALTPAPAAPAPASVLESVLGPLLGTGPLMPIESPVSLLMLAAARRLGVSDPGEAVVAPTAAAAVLPGRTTTITWAWGTDTVLDFDPTADRLDFGWFQPNNFDISELEGSTRIGIAGNNQSYTLDGVALGQLSTDNIIANEATTLTKWRDAIEAAGPVTQPPVVTPPADPSPPDTTVPDTTVPDTSAPDTTAPDTGTPDTSVPDTTAPDTGTPDTAARWGETFFAPYVDMGGWPVPDLVAISEATGATLFTAAFLQATPDGKAAWAGIPALEPGSGNEQVENINRSITSLQDAGGDVMVSLGGAAGTSLAQYYHARGLGAQELAEAYAGVVDTYRISHLDFDIEGAAVAEPASIALHSQALKLLQDSKPDLQVWYTLPVLPTGLTADGLNVVDSALNAGVDLAGVNVMAMDYGESAAPTSGPNAKTMGAYAIEAAESTHDQLTTLYAGYGKTYDFSQLGVTPMIGVNDVLSEVFTVADAQALEDFARANGLGMLSMWSVTRDNPGTFGQATPTASGLDAPAGSFAGVFADYGTQNTVEASTPGGTPGGGTLEPGGTTTTITWSWGSDTVLDFDPATDRLDFGWFQPTNFDIGEQAGSTRIAIVGNDQSYTLDGVALDALSTANIIALDANTLAKWQNAVGGAATTPPAVTPPAEPAEPSEPEVVTPPAEPAEPTEPEVVTPPVVDDTPDTGDGGAPATGGTTTVISWKWGTDTVLAFDPVTDRLDFGWFQPTNFDIGEQAGSTRIAIVGNDQSYTLDGVALEALSTANIIALDANTLAKWQNAVGGTATTPPAVTPPAEPATPEDTTPDTTVPDTTVPDTTVPDTTVPDTTVPDSTVPDTTVPDTTTPPVVNPPAAGGEVDPAQSALAIAAHDKVLAAYFPEWGIYGRDFQIADIPAEQLTHVIYSFLNLTSNGDVVLYDSYAAVDKRFSAAETVSGEADQWYYPPGDPRAEQTVWGNFNQLAQLKEQYPHLKVSAAIGGWTLSGNFSDVAATAAGRERMTDSIVDFLQTYQMFDGVDFDWEYPGGGGLASNSVSPQDGENYAALLATLRQKLDVLEQQTGREYEISVAAPGGYDKIANFNAAGLAPSVDFFNLMSYDFHGTWESTTGHQSALTADPDGYDIANAVGLYLAAGVDPSKIVIGAPLYTRAWSGVADGGDGGYLETASGKAPGSFEAGVYDYKDLLAQVQDPASGWKLYWDDNAQAAYVYNASEGLFSSFETPTSIAQKAQWADDLGLGGMMFWDISNDAVGSPEGLVNAAYQSWVLDRDLTEIRGDSSLTGEVVVGGDGAITALPNSINL